jgi:hypothetical protein
MTIIKDTEGIDFFFFNFLNSLSLHVCCKFIEQIFYNVFVSCKGASAVANVPAGVA